MAPPTLYRPCWLYLNLIPTHTLHRDLYSVVVEMFFPLDVERNLQDGNVKCGGRRRVVLVDLDMATRRQIT